jgi:hypothetical protein
MALEWEAVVVDARDPIALAHWWKDALGWVLAGEEDDGLAIRAASGQYPELLFEAVPEGKVVKNRLHLDFRPDDQGATVERLLAMGATHADVGQGNETWVVLADPEGNEFCVLSSRKSG